MKAWNYQILVVLGMTISLALPGSAQTQPSEDKLPDRGGFFIGFGVGFGSLGIEDVDDRESGPVAHLRIGGALNRTVLLAGESVAWAKEIDGIDVTSTAVVGAAYIYPSQTSPFYLKGGVGFANLELSDGTVSVDDDGTALILGAGYDIGFGGRFALSPQFDYIRGSYDGGSSNVAQLSLGLTWY